MVDGLPEGAIVSGETRTGLIGEHIACAAVLSMPGIMGAAMAQQDKIDLLAWDDAGYLRIQVKSRNILPEADGRTPCYHFNYGMGLTKKKAERGAYDIIASVAIDRRKVIFTALDCVGTVSKRIRARRFDDPDVEIDSWRNALAVVRGDI